MRVVIALLVFMVLIQPAKALRPPPGDPPIENMINADQFDTCDIVGILYRVTPATLTADQPEPPPLHRARACTENASLEGYCVRFWPEPTDALGCSFNLVLKTGQIWVGPEIVRLRDSAERTYVAAAAPTESEITMKGDQAWIIRADEATTNNRFYGNISVTFTGLPEHLTYPVLITYRDQTTGSFFTMILLEEPPAFLNHQYIAEQSRNNPDD